ncbi:ABC transporter ATP-binding protein [Acidipropionibacterium virtanenii]|uniref:Putative ABC transporter ATP-binding protein n=1 Tax=Acidipropionibacterium virtanenii TaxID=2057246 RepID=A0A344UXA4_9ACTN|nr:ABC transporter ATP-binding protein [Acidipropionibacterium virtanenii]AXE39902.1 putative ABC transporter ATP-binding protein [Acidipropionibacterium virtanenii]
MLVKLVGRYIRPYRWQVLVILLLQIGAQVASLTLPTINADIINKGVVALNTGFVKSHSAIMLAVAAGQAICQVAAMYLAAMTAMGLGRDIRDTVFNRTIEYSSREVNKFGAPSLITRTTNDVQQVQMLVFFVLGLIIGAPITMIVGVVMALRADVGLSWIIVVAVVLLGGVIGILMTRLGPLFRSQQSRIDDLNRVTREQITGVRVVRAFVREPYEAQRFNTTNGNLRDIQVSVGRYMAAMFPLVMFIMNISQIGVFWFASSRIDSGEIQVGALTSFTTYLIQILMSVMMAVMMIIFWPRATVCATRILEVLDTETSVTPPSHPVAETTEPGTVAFHDVEFSYPGADEPVLSEIDFTMAKGTTTAIIGSTGAGKTTLVNLIPRLFDVTGGSVLVDGVDVRALDPHLLERAVGLVPQKPYLFTGTVASNLRDGDPEATDEDLWEALRIAQADDFVSEMPEGLDAPIVQGGTNVSGGQRQRLSIARALVKKADVYLFDDSFSALDVTTDARLRAALAESVTESAILVVAQRVSTIRNADQILVIDDGRLVGRGTHEELLETCPTYVEIVNSQLSAEEAAA